MALPFWPTEASWICEANWSPSRIESVTMTCQVNSFVFVSRLNTPVPKAGVATGATSCSPCRSAVKCSSAALADTEVMQMHAAAIALVKTFMWSLSSLVIDYRSSVFAFLP